MLAIYNSLIYSYLSYCNVIWGCNTKTSLKKLLIYQKAFLRLMTSKHRREHTAPLFKQFNILRIDDIYEYLVGQFVFKWINNDSIYTSIFDDYFKRKEQIHNYFTRQIKDLHPGIYKVKEIGFYSIKVQGPRIWNSLPKLIKEQSSFYIFKQDHKKLLINNIIIE